MSIGRKIVSGFTLAAVMLAFSVGMAPAAHATPSCAAGHFCIWDGTNFSGTTVSMTVSSDFVCKTIPYDWAKNMASSYYNNTNFRLSWYDGDNCSGIITDTIYPGDWADHLSGYPNNTLNSFYVYPG